MKWFKHDSDAHSDARIEKLMAKYGLQGYGLYFYCLELISKDLGTDRFTFELEHDAQIIARRLYMSEEVIAEMMTYMVNLGLFENADGTITCLKLAHRLDQSMSGNPQIRALISGAKSGNILTGSGQDHDTVMTPSCPDKNRLEENRSNTNKGRKKFVPPTAEDLSAYCEQKGHDTKHIEPFLDYYISNGWKVGRNKMVDWTRAFNNWVRRSYESSKGSSGTGQRGRASAGLDNIFD